MICENCGKEHDGSYGSGRFCSCKCAHCFCTKNKRKEINEKLSKFYNDKRKKHFCISCNTELNKNVKYCDECIQYSSNKLLFEKLGINETNLKIANKEAIDFLKDLYFKKGESLVTIRENYKIQFNTIHFFFKKMELI